MMKFRNKKELLLTGAVLMLAGGLIASAFFWATAQKQKQYVNFAEDPVPGRYAALNAMESAPDFVDAAGLTIHAVVHIKTFYTQKSSVYDNFFGFHDFFGFDPFPRRSYPIQASGSGVIISSDGYIVTNNHVVQEAEQIEVTLNDKRTFPAKIIGRDPSTDLALIKVDEKDLPYILFGNSDDVKVGEWVLAVGNPFNLTSTVTAGIVSAKARNINILGDKSAIESFIQTDAAVNRGNSGGALVNAKGELVGVNAAIASNTGAYTGYSFAIPVNIVRKVMGDLKEFGEVQRAVIGASIMEVDSKLADEKGLKRIRGVYVAGVSEKGSAAEAGLEAGDIILEVNGMKVNSRSELLEMIGRQRPGDKVKVLVDRSGKERSYNLTLLNAKGTTDVVTRESQSATSLLGGGFADATQEELKKLGLTYGVKVISLEGGKMLSSGIREGFIITSVDNQPVRSVDDLVNYLNNKRGGVLIEGVYPNGMRAYYGFGL
ncbi:MAG: Do family serine endopeptidase [Bacteroidales bacterium]